MDREKIKSEINICRDECLNALANVVVGDCPTRIHEMSSEVEEAFERMITALKAEGVLKDDTRRVQESEDKD